MLPFIIVAAVLISAVVCHVIAKCRDENAVFWGVMGIIFGPLAIPFAFLSKPVSGVS